MAWAKSGLIGCGVHPCRVDARSESNEEMIRMVMVCHYKERGNVLTEEIYKEGPTCSACPPPTTCEPASGLCVRVKTI